VSGLGTKLAGPCRVLGAILGTGVDLLVEDLGFVPFGVHSGAQLTTDLELVRTRGI
jgi:hypothetical protein